MMVAGIEVSTEELKDFQDGFLGSRAARVVGLALEEVLKEAQGTLEDCGAGADRIRQAQGMVLAVRRFDEITALMAKADPDAPEKDDGVDETEDKGGTYVDF